MFRFLLVVAIGAIGNLTATEISGKWAGTMETGGVPAQVSLTMYQHGQEVSGTLAAGDETRQTQIEKAKIRGDQLTFEVHESGRIVKYRLTLAEGLLSGEASAAHRVSKVSLTPVRSTNPANAFEDGIRASPTAPILIHKVEPGYTQEARAAKVQGTVVLQVEIEPSGNVSDERIKVLRGLGFGLDEKAIEAVKEWKWKPAYKNGTPVAVLASVEVNFRLGIR